MKNGESEHGRVRIAIVGVGNCASSLIQGVHYYRDASPDREEDDARRPTEEFISRYGRGSAQPSERPAASAQD